MRIHASVMSLLILVFGTHLVRGILFFQGQTTACDICDRTSTNSVRNIMCCFKFSKCCLPDTLDEYNAKVAHEDSLGHSNYPATVHVPQTSGQNAAKKAARRSSRRRAANQKKRKTTKSTKKHSKSRQRANDRVVSVEW